MSSSEQTEEQRKSIALAASLFGDDAGDTDIFGGIASSVSPVQAASTTAEVHANDIFGPPETSNTYNDVNALFTSTYPLDSNGHALESSQEDSTSPNATIYAGSSSDVVSTWPDDTTSQFTQEATYTDQHSSWQDASAGSSVPLNDIHASYDNQTYDSTNSGFNTHSTGPNTAPYSTYASQPKPLPNVNYSEPLSLVPSQCCSFASLPRSLYAKWAGCVTQCISTLGPCSL